MTQDAKVKNNQIEIYSIEVPGKMMKTDQGLLSILHLQLKKIKYMYR